MNVQEGYDQWAGQYDTNENKTRDLEARSLREILADRTFQNVLEMGCGTGKNSPYLAGISKQLTAVDFSEKMLDKARSKNSDHNITFLQADLMATWNLPLSDYDLITFSLVLEHIENLHPIFDKINSITKPGSYVYIGELHPFRQYLGTRANFIEGEIKYTLPCYTHHISDFVKPATEFNFELISMKEYFDEEKSAAPPTIISFLFRKKAQGVD